MQAQVRQRGPARPRRKNGPAPSPSSPRFWAGPSAALRRACGQHHVSGQPVLLFDTYLIDMTLSLSVQEVFWIVQSTFDVTNFILKFRFVRILLDSFFLRGITGCCNCSAKDTSDSPLFHFFFSLSLLLS